MTGVKGLFDPTPTSNTRPILFPTVPSPSKSHRWLRIDWGSEMITLDDPYFTSSTNLGTKIHTLKLFWFWVTEISLRCLTDSTTA